MELLYGGSIFGSVYLTESFMLSRISWHRVEHCRYFRLTKSLLTSASALFHCDGVEGAGLGAVRGSGVVRWRGARLYSVSSLRGFGGVGSQEMGLGLSSEKENVSFDGAMSVLMRRGMRPGIVKESLVVD